MFLKEEFKSIESTPKKVRNFGLLLSAILLMLGCWFWQSERFYYWYFLLAGGLLIIHVLSRPSLFEPIYRYWMRFSLVLGWVMTRVILTILFFAVFTPMSAVAKTTGKKFLDTSFRQETKSYWIKKVYGTANYTKQF